MAGSPPRTGHPVRALHEYAPQRGPRAGALSAKDERGPDHTQIALASKPSANISRPKGSAGACCAWNPIPSQSSGRTQCPGPGLSPARRGVWGTSQRWPWEVTTQAHQGLPHYVGVRSRDRGSGLVAQTATDPMEMRTRPLHPNSLHGCSILLPSHTSPPSQAPSFPHWIHQIKPHCP